jgi:hypothetical protein
MVPSSLIAVTADSECLTCGGFSLSETFHLGNFKFITDYFGGLSLSPWRGDAGAALMGPTHSGASTLWWTKIGDSAEEFLTPPSREGSFGLPSPRRHDTEASHAPITTTLWMENAPITQAMMMVPLRTMA